MKQLDHAEVKPLDNHGANVGAECGDLGGQSLKAEHGGAQFGGERGSLLGTHLVEALDEFGEKRKGCSVQGRGTFVYDGVLGTQDAGMTEDGVQVWLGSDAVLQCSLAESGHVGGEEARVKFKL